MLVSIVVPTYRNAASLPDLHQRLQELASRNQADRFEFVFVDDGSSDDTPAVLEQLATCDARVSVLTLSRNFGSTSALQAGFEHSRGDAMVALAADLQDPPELVDELLDRWRAGSKVVLAVRRHRGDSRLSSTVSKAFYALFRRFAIAEMPPGGFDFFLVDRQVRDVLVSIPERNTYLMGLLLWMGFKPAIVHYDRRAREARYGRSGWTLPKKITYFADSFVAFSDAPIRLVTILGVCISLAGFVYAGLVILSRIVSREDVQGWTSLMVVVLLLSGTQLLMLGIIGEYLWRALDEGRRRPRYIIESIRRGKSSGGELSGDATHPEARSGDYRSTPAKE